MTSKPHGRIVIPVWSDDGVIKALVDDTGKVPVDADISGQTVDISGQTVDISGQTVDISGQTVDIDGQDVHVDNTSLICSIYTLYAGALRRNPFIFGFSDDAGESITDTNLSGGTNTLDGGTVPAGELWVVRQWQARYVGTPPTLMALQANGTLANIAIAMLYAPTASKWFLGDAFLVLKPGDNMRVIIYGATAGDDAYAKWSGYVMDYS
jgi:hypothetical protein